MECSKSEYEMLVEKYKNKDISECFASMHMSFKHEIDTVKGEMKAIDTRVVELEKFGQHANVVLENIHKEIVPGIDSKLDQERKERLKLEVWGRKWNLVFRGIPGGKDETPRVTEKIIRKYFANTLKLQSDTAESILFQAVHRLPGGKQTHRNVIVRFSNLIDRDEILERARKLPPRSGTSVVPDLPPEIGERRAKLLKRRWEMSEPERKKYKFIYLKEYPFVDLVLKPTSTITVPAYAPC